MFSDLQGKRVLVTGASGGIGSATARLLASRGAVLGLHYHANRKAAERLRAEIRALGGRAECLRADLSGWAGGLKLVPSFIRRFGGIEVLINNAGAIHGAKPFDAIREEEWDRTFALNARAPYLLAREAFKAMKRGGGRIINISSVSAKYGGSERSFHYGAAKAALEAMTVGLARRGAPHGILVNAVRAGFINTDFHRKTGRGGLARRIRMIPLGRAGSPLDVAHMILFLASDASSFVTGQVLSVSGGD